MNSNVRKSVSLFALTVFFGALLAACGGGPTLVTITAVDYELVPSVSSVSAGEVTFRVSNDAGQLHEFVVVQTDLAADELPTDDEGDVTEDGITVVDEIEDIEAGTSQDLTVTLEPGHYVLMCNLPAHYRQGMHIDFTVTP